MMIYEVLGQHRLNRAERWTPLGDLHDAIDEASLLVVAVPCGACARSLHAPRALARGGDVLGIDQDKLAASFSCSGYCSITEKQAMLDAFTNAR
jgi:hypothetical protein